MGLRILITNNALSSRNGPTVYVRDLALGLLKRGHTPLAYSTILGNVAHELFAARVSVVDDLNQLEVVPDLIHGHEHMETMTALLHFPGVPAIHFCHSSTVWYDTPLVFPRVLRYVAVDHPCRDRLLVHGIPEERIRVLLNFVDLDRFKVRNTPLPARPQRALIFSNYANSQTHLPAVREACRRAHIQLDVVGSGENNESAHPEEIIGEYDLVFAKARCALEALAVGSAVILCDASGVGPMVTMAEFDRLRPLNFGIRTLREPLNPDILEREIERYDSADAAAVSELVRSTAGHESVIDELISLYQEVIDEFQNSARVVNDEEGRAAARYLRQLKIDFATHGAASLRMRERLERFPIFGRMGLKLVRRFTGDPGK
ncbi:MAG TPA: glycosyltransferase [Pyrinomonadaceae bacterium]